VKQNASSPSRYSATRFSRPPVSVDSPVSTSVTCHGLDCFFGGPSMRLLCQVDGHVRHVQEVVGEVLLDDVTLVTAADDEVVDAMGEYELQDVPEDRPAADFDHRLRV
jgi:hypothetical protein